MEVRGYRSQDGRWHFKFAFVQSGSSIAIYSLSRPNLNGQDPSPHKTHLFNSGQVCIASGREPSTQSEAERLAGMWAEYYLEYRRTGIAQS